MGESESLEIAATARSGEYLTTRAAIPTSALILAGKSLNSQSASSQVRQIALTGFCPYCGAQVPPEALFCPNCGASLFKGEAAPTKGAPVAPAAPGQAAPAQAPAAFQASSLFDSSRQYYVIKRQWWGWGSGPIQDERGAIVGHLYRRVLTIRDTTEFREADDRTISATINRKLVAVRDTMDIKDGNEQDLARVKQKILAVFRPVVWVEDPNGKKLFEAKGNFLGFSFKVYDMQGKVVAEIDKLDMWKDIFLGGGLFDFKNTYAVVIHDPAVDRRLVVPLAIAIDEVVHEDRKDRR
jgi:uncharacterized protein YxjI